MKIEFSQKEKDYCLKLDAAWGLLPGSMEKIYDEFVRNEAEIALKGISSPKEPVGLLRYIEETSSVQYRDPGRYRVCGHRFGTRRGHAPKPFLDNQKEKIYSAHRFGF